MKRVALTLLGLITAFVAVLVVFGHDPAPIAARAPGETIVLSGGIERHDVRFACGETECGAWLYLPAGSQRFSAAVMGHGFAGTRDVSLPYFAEHLARAGIAALVIDYRHFGVSGGAPRQLVDPWRQLEDWRAALAFIRTRREIDPARIAVWGSSLGGGLALVTAADDQQVRAVVALAPQIDSELEGEASFPGVWWAAQIVFSGWGDMVVTRLGYDPITVPAIAPAGEWGMLSDDSAYAAFQKLVAPGTTYRNEVVAQSVFTFDDYNPASRASDIDVPVLLIASRQDRLVPFAAVETFAKSAKTVSVVEFEGDHFDVYSPPAAQLAAETTTAFLQDQFARPARETKP